MIVLLCSVACLSYRKWNALQWKCSITAASHKIMYVLICADDKIKRSVLLLSMWMCWKQRHRRNANENKKAERLRVEGGINKE